MMPTKPGRLLSVMLVCAIPALSGCNQSSLRINPDFGSAVRQDLAAQIADPDAHYEGTPAPGSSGARVGLAQKRYDSNTVVQPSTTTASSRASVGSNADNGGSGGGAGVGMGATP